MSQWNGRTQQVSLKPQSRASCSVDWLVDFWEALNRGVIGGGWQKMTSVCFGQQRLLYVRAHKGPARSIRLLWGWADVNRAVCQSKYCLVDCRWKQCSGSAAMRTLCRAAFKRRFVVVRYSVPRWFHHKWMPRQKTEISLRRLSLRVNLQAARSCGTDRGEFPC